MLSTNIERVEMKRILAIVIAAVVIMGVYAQSSDNPMDYYDLGQIVPLWADSGKSVDMSVEGKMIGGDYRNVFDAKRRYEYGVSVEGKAAVGENVSLGGGFMYSYHDRREQCWGMLTFAQSSPYYLADDQPGDQVSERYKLEGNLLYKPFGGVMRLAGEFDFMAATTAKRKDIRNKNTYNYYNIMPMAGAQIGQSVFMFGYGYSSVVEEVSLSRFGSDKVVWINAVEALWFGQRQPYSSSQFPMRRYEQERHGGVFNVQTEVAGVDVSGEVMAYKGTSEVMSRVEEKKYGYTEEKGVRVIAGMKKGQHEIEFEFNSAAEAGYQPIQRREYSGNTYHYVQYGRVRRSEREETKWRVTYEGSNLWSVWGVRLFGNTSERRMLLYPLTYGMQVKQVALGVTGGYKQRIKENLVSLTVDADYVMDNSGDEMLTNIDLLPEGYYLEREAMEKQYEHETSERIIINPVLEWSVGMVSSLSIAVEVGYKGVVTVGDSKGKSCHGVDVGLKVGL